MPRIIRVHRHKNQLALPPKPVEIPPDEMADMQKFERAAEMQEIAWQHLTGAHERYTENMDAGHRSAASEDSEMTMQWLYTYRDIESGKDDEDDDG